MTQVQFDKLAKRIEKFRCDKRDGKLVDHDAIASMKGVNKQLDKDKKEGAFQLPMHCRVSTSEVLSNALCGVSLSCS